MLEKFKLIMSKADKFFPPPLREILSENGVGSYSRVSSFTIVVATIFWVTYLVIHNHAMPDMAGPTAFIAGGSGSQYGLNQIKNWVSKKETKPEDGGGDAAAS